MKTWFSTCDVVTMLVCGRAAQTGSTGLMARWLSAEEAGAGSIVCCQAVMSSAAVQVGLTHVWCWNGVWTQALVFLHKLKGCDEENVCTSSFPLYRDNRKLLMHRVQQQLNSQSWWKWCKRGSFLRERAAVGTSISGLTHMIRLVGRTEVQR